MRFTNLPTPLREGWPDEPTEAGRAFQELLGPELVPEDLLRHDARDGGFLVGDPRPLVTADNCFVAVLERASPDLFEPVLQALTSTWFLAEVPQDPTCLMVHAPPATEGCAEIVYWDHEERCFHGPSCWDIPTALRVMSVYASSEDAEARRAAITPALGRYDNRLWPFGHIEEMLMEDGVLAGEGPPPPPAQSHFKTVHDRGYWIAEVLAGRRIAEGSLTPQLGYEPAQAFEGPWLARYAPTALYWQWRSFFFDDPWLAEILEVTRASPSRLVRDSASLIERIGRDESAGRDVAGVDLIAARTHVQELIERIRNPFPDRFEIGPMTLVRDDARGPVTADARSGRPIPQPPPGQPEDPRWAAAATALAASPDGTRWLVQGARNHPRYKRDPSAQPTIGTVFEVDADGYVHLVCDADRITDATYLDSDTIVLVSEGIALYERHGRRGVRMQAAPSNQSKTLFADGGRTIVRFGGVHNYDVQATVPRTVEIFRVDGRAVRWGGEAAVPLDVGKLDGHEVLLGQAGAAPTYHGDGNAFAGFDVPALTFGHSGLKPEDISPRVGPWAVVDELGFNDWCVQAAGGQCLIFKHLGGTEFEALVLDGADGTRPVEPPLRGTMGSEIVDADHAFVQLDGQGWIVELATGRATAVLDRPGTGFDILPARDHGALKIFGTQLVPFWSAGEGTPLEVGADAATLAYLRGGHAIAIRARKSPFVVLGLGADHGWRLLGAVDPDGPLGTRPVALLEHPRGVHHPTITVDGLQYELLGLERALAAAESAPPIATLPERPWEARPIELLPRY